MLRLFVLLGFLSLFGLSAVPSAYAQGQSDTDAIQASHSGQLENGLRYVVVTRRSSAFQDSSRVAIRMRIEGGWGAERDGENGLVHLIEHMPREANGQMSPEQVATFRDQETIVREWGAFTSPYASEFFLTTRSNTDPAIEQALRYFYGAVSGLRLTEELVDRQRDIVINEMAPRLVQARRLHQRASDLAPGSEWDLSRGYDSSDVATADLEAIRDLYTRVYRPENITIILVGEIDPASAVGVLRSTFGELPSGQVNSGTVNRKRGGASSEANTSSITVDSEAAGRPAVLVALQSPPLSDASSASPREAILQNRMMALILSHRLDLQALETGTSGAQFMLDSTAPQNRSFVWQADPAGAQWRPALSLLLDQVTAAQRNQFTDREVAVARGILLRETQNRHSQALSYNNSQIAGDISEAITRSVPIEPETERFMRERRFLEGITAKRLNSARHQLVGNAAVRARLEGLKENSETKLSLTLEDFVENYAAHPLPTLATDSKKTGEGVSVARSGAVVADTRSETGIRSLKFDNGSTLHLIRRQHDGPYLEMAVYVDAPATRRNLSHCDALVLPYFVTAGGTNSQSEAALRDSVWGKEISQFPFEMTSTGIRTGASALIEDAAIAFTQLHGLITRPGFRESAEAIAAGRSKNALSEASRDPLKPVIWHLESQLAPAAETDVAANPDRCAPHAEMERAALLLGPILREGTVNAAIAGNMDEEKMIALFAATFGADKRAEPIPERGAKGEPLSQPFLNVEPTIALAPDAGGQNIVGSVWPLIEPTDARERAQQELFTALFARMTYIKLVEQGSSYAPRVARIELIEREREPVLAAAISVPSEDAAKVAAAMQEVAAQLADTGPDPKLLEVIRKMMIDGMVGSYNQDRVWAYQAAQLGQQPDAVRIWRGASQEMERVTAQEIQDLARQTFAQSVTETRTGETSEVRIGN